MVDDNEAMKRAVRAFYEGAGFPEYEKMLGKPLKYNKEFFDNYEKELRVPKKKELNKSKEPIEEMTEEDID